MSRVYPFVCNYGEAAMFIVILFKSIELVIRLCAIILEIVEASRIAHEFVPYICGIWSKLLGFLHIS